MSILIYADEGTGARSRDQAMAAIRTLRPNACVRFTDAFELGKKAWAEQTQLIVFPGGRDLPYHAKLRGSANTRIRDFVLAGGSYLGLCAGGYYGSSRVEFDVGLESEVIGSRELEFFKGAAIGPAYGVGTFVYQNDSGARAAMLEWPEIANEVAVYYDGGCYFSSSSHPDSAIEVLARYREIEGCPAAIVACSVGSGCAILSGVHPEFSSAALGPEFETPADVVTRIFQSRCDLSRGLDSLLKRLKV